jgi:YD repeat-containing protein
MTHSSVTSHIERTRTSSAYAYDAFGRRTIVQDEGGDAVRTLYDGTSFEVIREGVTFRNGSFTTRYSEGIQWTSGDRAEGMRYRWLGDEGTNNVRTQRIEGDAYTAVNARHTGTSVTLYGRGEAAAVSRSAGANTRGGTAYLGKDILGSVRTATNEYEAPGER